MPTLLDVVLETLSASSDDQELAGARDLVQRWSQIVGELTDDERQLMEDPAGFVAYAYAIVINAVRTESNPRAAQALRRSRIGLLALL